MLKNFGFKEGHSKEEAFYQECWDFWFDDSHPQHQELSAWDDDAVARECEELLSLVGPKYFSTRDRDHLSKGAPEYTSEWPFALFGKIWDLWAHMIWVNRSTRKRRRRFSETESTFENTASREGKTKGARLFEGESTKSDEAICFLFPDDTIAKVKRQTQAARQANKSASWVLKSSTEKEYLVSRQERLTSDSGNWFVRGEDGQLWLIMFHSSRQPGGALWNRYHCGGITERIIRDADGIFGQSVGGVRRDRPCLSMLSQSQDTLAPHRFFAATDQYNRHSIDGEKHASWGPVPSPLAERLYLTRPRPTRDQDSIIIGGSAGGAKRSHAVMTSSDSPETDTDPLARWMDLKKEASQAASQNSSPPSLLVSEVREAPKPAPANSPTVNLRTPKKFRPTISDYMLENTRLRISLASHIHFGTIRASLGGCFTVEQIFEGVLAKWWDEFPEEKLGTVPLSLTYGWGGPT